MRRLALVAILPIFVLPLVGMRLKLAEPTTYPLRQSVTVQRILDKGALVFAAPTDRLALLVHKGETVGFELELLRSFASPLGAGVDVRSASNASTVVGWLQGGIVDVAFLPWRMGTIPGLRRLEPYVPVAGGSEAPTYPETGALWVRDDSPDLFEDLLGFLGDPARGDEIARLHEQYHVNYRQYRLMDLPEFGPISPYDRLIARHADRAGFDWRFVAALIFVESRFQPHATSSKGAQGLMQIMPVAARAVGMVDVDDPESNIRAGTRYLKRLSQTFSGSEGQDHLAIVLAAYLIGPGHMTDAQALARDLDLDPHRWWGSLDQVVPLLEDPEFYEDMEHGFAQGSHAVEYVRKVFQRYGKYRKHPASPTLEAPSPTVGDPSPGIEEVRRELGTATG